MKRIWDHMRQLWPRWTLLPAVPFVGWGVFWIIKGGFRWDHLAMMTVIPALAYGTARTRKFFVGMVPFFLVGLVYDSTRFIKNWGLSESTVHVCDLWEIERKLFGIPINGVRTSLTDIFQKHHALAIDLLCAIPYGTFFVIVLAYGAYLYLRDFTGMQRFGWAFLLMSVAGFATYHIYPAAPPWYLHQYGCVVDLNAHSSAGAALLRVDAFTGIGFFNGMYGRASEVFGAMPSLHVAYPLLTLLAAWRNHRWPLRSFFIGFYALMCFSALYLDHHWLIDVVVGSLFAIGARLIVWPLIPDPAPTAETKPIEQGTGN